MPILVGIDGTGSSNTGEYNRDTARSFVRRLCYNKGPNIEYYRGPYTSGRGLSAAIRFGLEFIAQRRRALGGDEPILLTGHSRGALGVMVIAQTLQQQNVNVRAAMLFDCVDMHADFNAPVIPSNVARALHVMRNPRTNSRRSFGNAATRGERQHEFPNHFMCTHGGMGGCPWARPANKRPNDLIDEGFGEEILTIFESPFTDNTTRVTYEQDARVSGEVWNYCQDFLRRHEFI